MMSRILKMDRNVKQDINSVSDVVSERFMRLVNKCAENLGGA